MEAHGSGKVRAAIGRASNFFGPDDYVVTDLAFRNAVEGKTINLLGRSDQPHTFSYVPDFGKLLATLGTREDALGQTWFTPSPAAVTQAKLVELIEAELGRPVKVLLAGKTMLPLPLFARLALKRLDCAQRLSNHPQMDADSRRFFLIFSA